MPSFVKSARITHDVETNTPLVEINYTKYKDGEGYLDFSDCFTTTPYGGWTHIDSRHESLRYEMFLETMVQRTIETVRQSVSIELDNVLCHNENIRSLVRVMNSIKILDPTFIPPIINFNCSWQKNLVKSIVKEVFPHIIETCNNFTRLEKLFNVLKLIEIEM